MSIWNSSKGRQSPPFLNASIRILVTFAVQLNCTQRRPVVLNLFLTLKLTLPHKKARPFYKIYLYLILFILGDFQGLFASPVVRFCFSVYYVVYIKCSESFLQLLSFTSTRICRFTFVAARSGRSFDVSVSFVSLQSDQKSAKAEV